MAYTRLSMAVILLLSGVLLLGEMSSNAKAVACPLYCLEVEYMTCPSSGEEHLSAHCNCCLTSGSKGCTLHLSGGSQMKCS
ncbi:Potato type II proteinase inhibitor family [Carex littledalei]|uniref:Potato type II proteinase inhibitor family n=1 Tax=Carex littledalei TaxID=544730 RepID=A0A833QL80_9POAL|nr:Potato type II proteinase inhibitor family [Carex littledalei]